MKELKCPYCGNEFDLEEFEIEDFDIECPSCEQEFEVGASFELIYNEEKIEFYDCLVCGKNTRSTHILSRGPWPKSLEGMAHSKVCDNCYHKQLVIELGGGGE